MRRKTCSTASKDARRANGREDAKSATRVVHCSRSPYDVYIGRPGPWRNPFPISHERTREQSLAEFREWLPRQHRLIQRTRRELKARTLGCWCKPKPCHGDIWAEILDA